VDRPGHAHDVGERPDAADAIGPPDVARALTGLLSGGVGARPGRTLVAERPGPPMRDLVEGGHMTPARIAGADQAQAYGVGLGVGHVHGDLAGGVVLTVAEPARA